MPHHQSKFVPKQASDITLAWLETCLQRHRPALKAKLIDFRSRPNPKQGMTSSTHILDLTFAQDKSAKPNGHSSPNKLLAKFSSNHPQAQEALAANRGFQREFDFYQHFGAQSGLTIPFCYWAHYDPLANQAGLLLEYIEDTRATSVFDGHVQDIQAVLDQLAPFHSRWWNQSEKLAALCQGQDSFIVDPILAKLDLALTNIRQHYRAEIGETLITLLEQWIAKAHRLIPYEQQRPQTLCHGDLHRDQILFPRTAEGTICIIDWQMASRDSGAYDLAYLLMTGLRPEQRKSCEQSMVENYHAQLLANGVTDYPLETLWGSYRISIARIAIYFLSALAAPDIAPILAWWESDEKRKGVSFWEATYQGLSQAIDQHGVLDYLEQID
jgi:thiamine kinase-like enzyme